MDILYEGNTLEYWKNNAEEDYAKVPISVLKYISVLEDVVGFSVSREKVEVLLFNLAEHYGMTSTKSEIDDFNIWISENL